MEYSLDLPPNYKSWVAFYEAAKPYLLNGVDDLHWHVPLPAANLNTEATTYQEFRYSVRYIEQQTLAELYERRQLKTFSRQELGQLRDALQMAIDHNGSSDSAIRVLKQKVDTLYMTS